MSKMELARLAGISSATIDRIERGESCRLETRRKIILALGYTVTDKEIGFSFVTGIGGISSQTLQSLDFLTVRPLTHRR